MKFIYISNFLFIHVTYTITPHSESPSSDIFIATILLVTQIEIQGSFQCIQKINKH